MCLFIMPYLSLINEKELKLAPILRKLKLKSLSLHSHKRPIISEEDPPRVIYCTIEKANQLYNRLLEKKQLTKVTQVLIDEMHLIGDEQRGYLLELLLTKLTFSGRKYKHAVQVIGMSATFPNLNQLATWIDAELFVTEFRPIQIKEYVKALDTQMFYEIMVHL
jgi:replicative superfamily II helicase